MTTEEWQKLARKHLMDYRSSLVRLIVNEPAAAPAFRERMAELDLLIDGEKPDAAV